MPESGASVGPAQGDAAQEAGPAAGGYPEWLTRALMGGGIVAVLTSGVLLNFGFLSPAESVEAGLRWAAQVLGVCCLALGLLSIAVPFAEQRRAAPNRGP